MLGETLATQRQISVQRATAEKPDDALALIEEYYQAMGVVQRDDRESLLCSLADPESAIWTGYVDGVPAGCILYRPLPNLGSAGEIKRLYVRAAYRGRGLAIRLLEALEQFAQSQNVCWLYLDTKDDLQDAIAFYRGHGYIPCER